MTLVAAHVDLPEPAGVELVRIGTTAELDEAVRAAAREADAVVMAAAPADFRPVSTSEHKIKKTPDGAVAPVELEENPDVLAGLVGDRADDDARTGQVLVGFAAETGDESADVLTHARVKLQRKGCDLLVVNDVSGGAVFGSESNAATVLAADGSSTEVPEGSKAALAHVIWDLVAPLLRREGS